MSWKPATPYTRATATAKAKELNPYAFCKLAKDCPADERYQVLVEAESYTDEEGEQTAPPGERFTFLVASGADWVEALAEFHAWMETHHGPREEAPPAAQLPDEKLLAAAQLLRQAMTPEEREAADALRLREMDTHEQAKN